MLPGYPESAICVQRFDDSLNSAIHTTYRNWLRSSSMHEPRDPPLEVVKCLLSFLSEVNPTRKSVILENSIECVEKCFDNKRTRGRSIYYKVAIFVKNSNLFSTVRLKPQGLPHELDTVHSGFLSETKR